MSKFKKLNKVSAFINKERTVKVFVYKYQKVGTQRFFFAAETGEGKRLTNTMFARKYSADALAPLYFKSLNK